MTTMINAQRKCISTNGGHDVSLTVSEKEIPDDVMETEEDTDDVGLRKLQQRLQQASDTIVKLQEQLNPTCQLQSQPFIIIV